MKTQDINLGTPYIYKQPVYRRGFKVQHRDIRVVVADLEVVASPLGRRRTYFTVQSLDNPERKFTHVLSKDLYLP